jgi:hypothetical protein
MLSVARRQQVDVIAAVSGKESKRLRAMLPAKNLLAVEQCPFLAGMPDLIQQKEFTSG